MIRHLLKLVWNRKRGNLLIMAEIAISFLVLFCVVMLSVYFTDNYRQPLGFDYDRVWVISIDRKQTTDDTWTPEMVETTKQLHLALADLPEIESSAGALTVPYELGGSSSAIRVDGREIEYEQDEVTDDFAQVLGLRIVQGRWFSREDDGADVEPVVLNKYLAREIFGSEDVVGRLMTSDGPLVPGGPEPRSRRVIGVVSDFRKQGEFAAPSGFLFHRAVLGDAESRPPANIVIKVGPSVTAVFEEKLVSRMQAIAKDWSFQVSTLESNREASMRLWLTPVCVAGLVAGFLMLMVALGLTGVLWQNVTRRTSEIGLRRVQGATARDIYVQIVGELAIVTTFALVLGVVVVVQIPLLELLGDISTWIYGWSIAISLGLVYLLTLACGLYPSWLATRVEPVQALRYE